MKSAVHCKRLALAFLLFLAALLPPLAASATGSEVTSAGSGFVITADGYILTNEHVVGDSETVTVYVGDNSYPATVVTKSVESDLALLKIAASGLTPVSLGNSLSLQLLDDVVALGYPLPQFGRDLTVSEGRITSFRTNVAGREGRDTLQHDAVITHGSSGGPLFSRKGEVIGINFAGVEGSGMQLAIPVNEAVPLLRSIPSFNPSRMGTATQTLTPQGVVTLYTRSVVYIEVATVVNWQDFLPGPTTVQGFPNEGEMPSLAWLDDWPYIVVSPMDWLADRGFDVVGGAALSGSAEPMSNMLAVVVLSDPGATERAAQALLADYVSTFSLQGGEEVGASEPLANGNTAAAGIGGVYQITFRHGTLRTCVGFFPDCGAYNSYAWGEIEGAAIFTVGNVILLVTLHCSSRHAGQEWKVGGGLLGTNEYCYYDGTLVRAFRKPNSECGCCYSFSPPDVRERLCTVESFATKLEALIRLCCTVLANKLSE